MSEKFGIKALAVGRKDVFLLAPADIQEESGWNSRLPGDELDAHIRSLADSIKAVGVLQPITVYMRDGGAVVTDGHCRLMAANLAISEGAEIKAIPVRVEERYSNEADRTLSLLTRNSGKPLTVPEQASVVKRLMAFGWEVAEIRSKTGHTVAQMGTLVQYLQAPRDIQELVKAGSVSVTTAVNTVREQGHEAASATLAGAVEKAGAEGKKRATAKHIGKKADPLSTVDKMIAKMEDSPEKDEAVCTISRLRELLGV